MKLKISDTGRFGRGRSWLVTCYTDGKRVRRSFETRAEAEQYANETQADPIATIRKPLPKDDKRGGRFFSVDQFVAIMSAARPNERGMLAVASIGGMRPWILERLPVNCVDMDHRRILIPSSFSMDRRPWLLETESIHPANGSAIPGLPGVLWEWLKIFPFEPRPWGPITRRLAGKLGYWIQGGCRNTAATYYNRLHGMAATAAFISCVSGYHGVMHHYLDPVSQADAERFYSIRPTDFLGKRPRQEIE